jgi:hypothetical protein
VIICVSSASSLRIRREYSRLPSSSITTQWWYVFPASIPAQGCRTCLPPTRTLRKCVQGAAFSPASTATLSPARTLPTTYATATPQGVILQSRRSRALNNARFPSLSSEPLPAGVSPARPGPCPRRDPANLAVGRAHQDADPPPRRHRGHRPGRHHRALPPAPENSTPPGPSSPASSSLLSRSAGRPDEAAVLARPCGSVSPFARVSRRPPRRQQSRSSVQ